MDATLFNLIALVPGLLIGGVGAYILASRPAADLRARLSDAEERARAADTALGETRTELAAAKERAARSDELARQLDETRTKRAALSERLAQIEATAAEREKAHAEQKAALVEAREAMLSEFKATGAEVLKANQDEFLKRAEARFKESEATGEAKIKALLNPVGERLEKYEQQVETLEKQRVDAFGQLNGLIQSMRDGQEQVRREAQRLGNSLTNAPKARGRWGEQQLKNLLEQVGLAQHTDFELEASIETEEGRLRPDAIVRIPGGKVLVIDAKVSLNAYQEAFEADDDDARGKLMDAHVSAMKGHVMQLASKGYQSQFEEAPDYVVMFVPGEHFVSAALNHDPKLWDFAFDKRVLLATPTNLVAIARTVAQVWRQEDLAKEAQEIGRLGSELYDRLAKVTGDLATMGTHLNRAVGSYNTFTSSFESRVLVSARKMSEKGIEIGKRDVVQLDQIEARPTLPKASQDENKDAAE